MRTKLILWAAIFFFLWHGTKANTSEKCVAILKPNFSDCKNLQHHDELSRCSSNKACQKHFNITAINVEPFVEILQHVVFHTVGTCCGACRKMSEEDVFTVSADNISLSLKNATHFVYPVLGVKSEQSIYGYHFIPIVELSNGLYITKAVTSKQVMSRLIRSCLNLWPFLVIIVLLALITGFMMWIIDTWKNKDEFSRRFINGWMDGFWWSFITMTTVGYGDKSPKHLLSRLLSVLWILVGITIISIFTGALTNEITSAANSPEPDMHGKHVGVLKYRTFDALFVAKHGGIIKETQGQTEAENIADIKRLLQSGEVSGIFLDKFTYMHTVTYAKSAKVNPSQKELDIVNFFLHETHKVRLDFGGETMAYGVLVEWEEDYQYFEEFIKHNQAVFETCSRLGLNEREEKLEEVEHDIFHPDAGVFFNFLYGCLGVIGVIFIFGVIFEMTLYVRKKGKSEPVA